MRKSKIMIGLGTLLLAGAGAVAAVKTYVPTQVWYLQSSSGPCVDTVLDIECELGGSGCLGNDVSKPSSFGKQLYYEGACQIPLKPIMP